MELHDYSHLRDAHWDEDVFVILSWSPSRASLEPSSQTCIFWYFYVIMLLLPGDVSLMFGFDSTVDVDDRDHTFDDGWSDVVRFSAYSTSDSILGHISVSIKVYGSSWICMLVPTHGMHVETRTCSSFYHDDSVEPLLSHLVRPVFFDICMSSCFLFWETFPWRLDSIWITGITHLIMDYFVLSDFMIYHTFDTILGHVSFLAEIYRSSRSCMLVPTYEIYTEAMTYLLSCHDPPVESLLSHSVRLTLFGI